MTERESVETKTYQIAGFTIERKPLVDDPHYDVQITVTRNGRTRSLCVSGGEPTIDSYTWQLMREFDND